MIHFFTEFKTTQFILKDSFTLLTPGNFLRN